MISLERALQEEHNGLNFSSVAPSSEELERHLIKTIPWFLVVWYNHPLHKEEESGDSRIVQLVLVEYSRVQIVLCASLQTLPPCEEDGCTRLGFW